MILRILGVDFLTEKDCNLKRVGGKKSGGKKAKGKKPRMECVPGTESFDSNQQISVRPRRLSTILGWVSEFGDSTQRKMRSAVVGMKRKARGQPNDEKYAASRIGDTVAVGKKAGSDKYKNVAEKEDSNTPINCRVGSYAAQGGTKCKMCMECDPGEFRSGCRLSIVVSSVAL